MAMSEDTRRRVVLAVVALIIVAFVLATAACTNTTDASGDDVADDGRLAASSYPEQMNGACVAANDLLRALPTPPSQISDTDWAGEVARIIGGEAAAFDRITVSPTLRDDHRALVLNTEQQSEQWASVSAALGSDDQAAVGELSAEIGALTLGRNDLAIEMGLTDCAERAIGS